jgi:hypothetical protein
VFVPLLRVASMSETSFTFTHPTAPVRYIPTILFPITPPGRDLHCLAAGYLRWQPETDGSLVDQFQVGDKVTEINTSNGQVYIIRYIRATATTLHVGAELDGANCERTIVELASEQIANTYTAPNRIGADPPQLPNELSSILREYDEQVNRAWIKHRVTILL